MGRWGKLFNFWIGGQVVRQTSISWTVGQFTRHLSWTSGKSHKPLFYLKMFIYLFGFFLKQISPSATKERPLHCIKHTECDMDWEENFSKFSKKYWMSSKHHLDAKTCLKEVLPLQKFFLFQYKSFCSSKNELSILPELLKYITFKYFLIMK